MAAVFEIAVGVVSVVLLFLASTVFFDVVHWSLHRMLTSGLPALETLAWPHGIHHQWIDRHLRVNWEFQTANVWCHLVLEYLTQLTFTGLLAFFLPASLCLGLLALQTLVFFLLLRDQGLDLNHRAQLVVEVAPPMFVCPVAYHAQHHAYPDAYFSSYVKVVDALLGTALDLRSLRIAFLGDDAFTTELRDCSAEAGAEVFAAKSARDAGEADVLVLGGASGDLESSIEDFLAVVGARQLPPEVWAVASPDDGVARYYLRDRRFLFRPILLSPDVESDADRKRSARTTFAFLCRGAHVPRTSARRFPRARFKRTRAVAPRRARRVETRREWVDAQTAH